MADFQTLVHADWSCHPEKRWAVHAKRAAHRWQVEAPKPVGDTIQFLNALFKDAEGGAVLAGFDFPIGVPKGYGLRTGLDGFVSLLRDLNTPRWETFDQVADVPGEICIERPFYPASSRKGVRRHSLVEAHGVYEFDDLRRACEKSTNERRAACPLFWTLGGNQVGKAALNGWKTIVAPSLAREAAIWPFDGALSTLAAIGTVVIAETYPAEAYGHIGVSFRKQSKTDQRDRAAKADAICAWTEAHGVEFDSDCQSELKDGFGPDRAGEDRFDALLGLLGMIEVVDHRRTEGCPPDRDILRWEGWIMGQTASI